MKNKIIKIKNETYSQMFWWIKAETDREFTQALKSKIPTLDEQMIIDDDGRAQGECIELIVDGCSVICFWFQEKNYPAMCHELLHATFMCARSHGLVLSKDSEEAYCYLYDWLIGQILKRSVKGK